MISINEALAIVRDQLFTTGTDEVAVDQALGRVLARDLLAPEPSPRFDNSAMDGFAVRAVDIAAAGDESPVTLRLIGESRAGVPFAGRAEGNTCIRISTGAMLPKGYDTVVRVEDTADIDDGVLIKTAALNGKDVRLSGEEYQTGDLLLEHGQRLAARHLAILAAVGADTVTVFRCPRVALLVTGSELTTAGQQPGPGQIRDSNRVMLTAAISESGGVLIHSGRVGDDLDDTVVALEQALAAGPDLVICVGGVSVGPHDHVKAAAARTGFVEHFWRVRQKPGKPLFFAGREETLFFGLPGNPVSAYICFCHYLMPLLDAMSGLPWQYRTGPAVAGEDIANHGRRPNLLRVSSDGERDGLPLVRPVRSRGSHMISSIVAADGYLLMEAESMVKAGTRVDVIMFPDGHEPNMK